MHFWFDTRPSVVLDTFIYWERDEKNRDAFYLNVFAIIQQYINNTI